MAAYNEMRIQVDRVRYVVSVGFGGQYLLVLPEHDVVAVINSWNLFGGRFSNLRDALVQAVARPGS